ncbi:sensor histidine kinase [Kineococcus sp. SYSU DK005]|uniref:sensor histidine kinase n=1 Tax=Kineococcus sp. SYSU DK005 TaxID=3383126 RepID=UPI003D7D811F
MQVQRWAHLTLSPAATAFAALVALGRWRGADAAGRRVLRPVPMTVVAGVGLGLSTVLARVLGWDAHDATRVSIAVVWGLGTSAIAVHLLLHALRVRLVMYGMGELVSGLDPSTPLVQVQQVLRRVLGDPTAQVLVAGSDGKTFHDVDGAPVTGGVGVPPVTAGSAHRTWHVIGTPPAGALVHSSTSPPDAQVLEGVLRALTLLVGNLRLQEELQEQLRQVRASRARLVDAADAERRRIERDLHDGAQQHLVVSALDVHLARERLHEDPERAEQLLRRAEESLRAAVEEIRALARGLHPALLQQEGIGAAVRSLSERLPLHVALEDATSRRYPPAIETTAYFVLAEALVNVVKHAGTTEAAVRLHEADGHLLLEVLDHGRGAAHNLPEHGHPEHHHPRRDRPARGTDLSADPGIDPGIDAGIDPGAAEHDAALAGGSGLRGLADRVATVGGTLQLGTAPDGGTRVHARLPVPATPLAAPGNQA